jgi:hypothetical protein
MALNTPNFYCDPEIDRMLKRDVGVGPHHIILGTQFALHRRTFVLLNVRTCLTDTSVIQQVKCEGCITKV